MRLHPAPVELSDNAGQPMPVVPGDAELIELRRLVGAMGERLVALESAAQKPADVCAPMQVEEPESLPAPSLPENTGHSPEGVADGSQMGMAGDRRARGYLDGRRGSEPNPDLAHSLPYSSGYADGVRARQMDGEDADTADKKDRRIAELKVLVDELNADRAQLQATIEAKDETILINVRKLNDLELLMATELSERDDSIGRHIRRAVRLTAALGGRKVQLRRAGEELMFARNRGASLARDLEAANNRNRAEASGLILSLRDAS